jgi:hypothetical protein
MTGPGIAICPSSFLPVPTSTPVADRLIAARSAAA